MSDFKVGDKVNYTDGMSTGFVYTYNGSKVATVQNVINETSVLIVYPKDAVRAYPKDYGIIVNPSRLRKVEEFVDGFYQLPAYPNYVYYAQKKGDEIEYTHTVDPKTGKMAPLTGGPVTLSRNVTQKLIKFNLVKGDEVEVESKKTATYELNPINPWQPYYLR